MNLLDCKYGVWHICDNLANLYLNATLKSSLIAGFIYKMGFEMDSVSTVINILKKFNIILFVLFGVSLVITFDIINIRERIGINDLDKIYLSIIGIIFLITGFCLIFLIFDSIFRTTKSYICENLNERRFKKSLPKILNDLSDKEIAVMMQFLVENSDTIWLPNQAPEVSSLSNKNLIFLSSPSGRNIANGMAIFHYTVNTDINDVFSKFLSDKIGEPFSDNALLYMRTHLPVYMREIQEHKRIWKI